MRDAEPTVGGVGSIVAAALLVTTFVLLMWPETRRELRGALHRRPVVV
jgi:hypothetical protein